jgi:hypothetical protein
MCLCLMLSMTALGQQPGQGTGEAAEGSGAVVPQAGSAGLLDWSPPAWAVLGERAEMRNGFVLDRTALGAVAALLPESDSQARPAIRKLDGIGVHLYRFHNVGEVDAAQLERVREAYHARGWKHLVEGRGVSEPGHHSVTDVWLAMDGVDVRGGAMLIVTPRSVSLVSFAGDLSPIDLLHLRGHFGIPKADSADFIEPK